MDKTAMIREELLRDMEKPEAEELKEIIASQWKRVEKTERRLRAAKSDIEIVEACERERESGKPSLLYKLLFLEDEWRLSSKLAYFLDPNAFIWFSSSEQFAKYKNALMNSFEEMRAKEERLFSAHSDYYYTRAGSYGMLWAAQELETAQNPNVLYDLFDNQQRKGWRWDHDRMDAAPHVFDEAYSLLTIGRYEMARKRINILFELVKLNPILDQEPECCYTAEEFVPSTWYLHYWCLAQAAKSPEETKRLASKAILAQMRAFHRLNTWNDAGYYNADTFMYSLCLMVEFDLDPEWTKQACHWMLGDLCHYYNCHPAFFKARELGIWGVDPKKMSWPSKDEINELKRKVRAGKKKKKRRK